MAWFPFFMDVSQGDGLIVGGGAVALRKVEKLLPYGPRLTVCAPSFLPELEAIPGLVLLRRPFDSSLVEEKLFVIAATGDRALNRQIAALCRAKHIPVNAVDDRDACTFLFPALVKRRGQPQRGGALETGDRPAHPPGRRGAAGLSGRPAGGGQGGCSRWDGAG